MQADRNTPYTVQKGDCLWDLSQRFYKDPTLWPVIFNYNNQPRVVCETGTVILDPDLILVGQKLVIPAANKAKAVDRIKMIRVRDEIIEKRKQLSAKGVNEDRIVSRYMCSNKSLPNGEKPLGHAKAKMIDAPKVEIDLGKVELRKVKTPMVTMTMEMEGKLLVEIKNDSDLSTTIKQSGAIELATQKEAETIVGKLIADTKLELDKATGSVKLSSGIAAQLNGVKVSMEAAVVDGKPALKGSQTFNFSKAKVGRATVLGTEITVAIVAVMDNPEGKKGDRSAFQQQSETIWDDLGSSLGAGGIILTAVGLIVGTIIEDFLTAGLGIADDAVCFALAAAMIRGALVIGTKPIGRITMRLGRYATKIESSLISFAQRTEKVVYETAGKARTWAAGILGVSTPAIANVDTDIDLVDE
ncbi:LysM peptidoglycan-binding domain-containing protein [Oceanobacter kriegii]|uniref:LysM peptidoglycan-binding domain-containing protein n=1 Tax=Oceanobacter kriegii TaxID=64972 RepID=UPI000486923D|nr:LysM peptidoglycan-binding domain-containing protein [Oceanobacter kriegii]